MGLVALQAIFLDRRVPGSFGHLVTHVVMAFETNLATTYTQQGRPGGSMGRMAVQALKVRHGIMDTGRCHVGFIMASQTHFPGIGTRQGKGIGRVRVRMAGGAISIRYRSMTREGQQVGYISGMRRMALSTIGSRDGISEMAVTERIAIGLVAFRAQLTLGFDQQSGVFAAMNVMAGETTVFERLVHVFLFEAGLVMAGETKIP
jgi:hypothetical protein